MTQMPGNGGSPVFGYAVIAIGVVEVALAVGFAAFTGLWWVLLLGLLAIPNFWLGLTTIRAARR
jgi:hypothetical protein